MKKILALLAAVFCMSAAFAQEDLKQLSVEIASSDQIAVYPCGDRHEAQVVISTRENFNLFFESTHDEFGENSVELDSIAGQKIYKIVFVTQRPGMNYDNRILTIKVEGFQDYKLPLYSLRDKEVREFVVKDPYSALRSPYFVNMEKGNNLMYEGQYQGAKDYYQLVRACPEYETDKENVDSHIASCDSLISWENQILEYEQYNDYGKALPIYTKMLSLNSSNDMLRTRYRACNSNFLNDCSAQLDLANHYFENKDYDRAEAACNRIISNNCSMQTANATTLLSQIKTTRTRINDHARSLMYDFGPNQAIGLTYGNFYRSKVCGMYVTLRLNVPTIDIISLKNQVDGRVTNIEGLSKATLNSYKDNPEKVKFQYDNAYDNPDSYPSPSDKKFDAELNFAFGWNWHIWEPIYLHFGIGYHGGGFNYFKKDKFLDLVNNMEEKHPLVKLDDVNTWDKDFKHDYTSIQLFHAAAPEAGIALKYWHVIAKVTYQYSIWINDKNYNDFCDANKDKIYFGIGFCW